MDSQNLYNEKIDPPADILINEPIRGTTTIREAILKHQELEIAPDAFENRSSGFALNTMIQLGVNVMSMPVKEIDVKDGKLPFRRKSNYQGPIEAAMKLPNGREVRDLLSLKVALMADKERILKGYWQTH